MEARAKLDGVSWVMLDTDDAKASARYVQRYGVRELPHFEFFSPDGTRAEVPEAGGPVDVERIAARVHYLLFPDED